MAWINRLYILFIGIILVLTTGFGIAAFYPEPQRALYSAYLEKPFATESCYKTPESVTSPECKKLEQEREQKARESQEKEQKYQNERALHTRTTIFLGITIGAFFTLFGLYQVKKTKLLSHGFLLAGVLTMLLTKFTVTLASLGAGVVGTETANIISYAQFGILITLAISVILVGQKSLKENP